MKCAANGLTIIVITLLSGIFFLALGILYGRVWYYSSSFPQVIESAVHWFWYLYSEHWGFWEEGTERHKCSFSFNVIISKIEACSCGFVLSERHNVLAVSHLWKVVREYTFRNEWGFKLTSVSFQNCILFVILICLLKITHYWAAYWTH